VKILLYAGGWPTNIGNAFIDYSSIYTIKTAVPTAKVYFGSELARWFFKANRRNMNKSVDLAELMEVDYLVISGMVLCDEFIELEGPIIKKLSDRGIKIVLNGCGGATYTQMEVNNFKKFLEGINIVGFISRDETTYKNFKVSFPKSFNGMDCAFFLSDAFSPAPLRIEDYVVYNFDQMEVPYIEEHNKRIIRTHHSCSKFFPNTIRNRGITLNINTIWPFLKIVKYENNDRYFKHKDTLISDIPDDYLNLYANAYAVYTDRVHACIAALSFGNSARLYSNTPRASVFDVQGVGEIRKKLVKLNQDKINKKKENQILFLREILEPQ